MVFQSIRFLTYLLFFLFPLLVVNCNSENSEYSKLENYYNKNALLHINVSDSLIAFCKANHTEVILRKSQFKSSMISFQILFYFERTFYSVDYDSVLNRHDPDPQKTSKYNVPFNIIKGFNESIYSAATADSIQVFFGDKWDVKFQLGTQGDSQYGILITSDTSISNKCEKRLSANVCLTERTIP
jgi:hypothetical protein